MQNIGNAYFEFGRRAQLTSKEGFPARVHILLSGVIAQLTCTMFFYQTKIAYLWSGMPILDWWLVIKCLTSVIKSIQEMQMCLQMGVWTSVYGSSVLLCGCVEVDCWRVDQCGRVHGIDWKFGQVLKCSSPSVELCNAWHCLVVLKCWSVGPGEKALSTTHAGPQDKKSTEAQTDFISHSNAFNLLHCYSTFLEQQWTVQPRQCGCDRLKDWFNYQA